MKKLYKNKSYVIILIQYSAGYYFSSPEHFCVRINPATSQSNSAATGAPRKESYFISPSPQPPSKALLFFLSKI
jgi:hypothetical protein